MHVSCLVTAPNPGNHRFRVTVTLPAAARTLVFPSWAPGSYLLREFVRNVRDLHAHTTDGTPVRVEKLARNRIRLHAPEGADVVLTYEVYAHEKSVRTPFLDAELAFFLPSNLLFHPEDAPDADYALAVDVPDGHVAVCPVAEAVCGPGRARFAFADVDTMHDSFVAIGPFQHTSFEVHGIAHHHWIEPGHDGDLARMNDDLRALVVTAGRMFGDTLPYPRYDFVTLLMARGHGGLEHKDGCVLLRPRTSLSAPKEYEEFVTLAAHEHFHAWNVKRIHPDTLGPRFDYAREHYTRDLWWLEGGTVYYEERITYRAGKVDAARHLARLADLVQRVLDSPGARHQPLEESSFDAWIKLYRPGEDSPNSTLSYYVKGAVVCLGLDLELRHRSGGRVSLDDVVSLLWSRWAQHGRPYPERALRDLVAELVPGDADLLRWFDAHVRGTEPVHVADALDHVGIDLVRAPARSGSALGIEANERMVVDLVREDGPAAGVLSPGDEILAVNGFRTTQPSALAERMTTWAPGTHVVVTLTRDGRVRTAELVTAAPRAGDVQLVMRPSVDPARQALRDAWLARTLPA
ncbi:MAG: hypothetical protein RLZZ299_2881 [Pseudomonadota bacterium]